MRKLILSAALCAAILSAKAQMSVDYIGKASIENLKVSFRYTRFSDSDETVVIKDTTYSIDWKRLEICVDGKVYQINKSSASPSKRTNFIEWNGQTLILKYSADWKRLIGYDIVPVQIGF